MKKIYINSDDTNVAARKVYAKSDGYAYAESNFKTKVSAEDLEDAFIKGLIVVADGVQYKPISCKVASKVATVTYVTTDTTTATTAKLATVKSA